MPRRRQWRRCAELLAQDDGHSMGPLGPYAPSSVMSAAPSCSCWVPQTGPFDACPQRRRHPVGHRRALRLGPQPEQQ
ncbi:hypothetical protein, partial [Streptomyces sp. NPDC001999]